MIGIKAAVSRMRHAKCRGLISVRRFGLAGGQIWIAKFGAVGLRLRVVGGDVCFLLEGPGRA